MPARHYPIGEPAHASEAQAIDFLVGGLPDDAVVYSNGWAVERDGRWNEVDAVVMVPAVGVWVVEIKGYVGRVTGNEHDWYVGGGPIRSPIRLNDKTAKVLASQLGRELQGGRRPRVEGLIFLSEASELDLSSMAARQRTRTRETILDALTGADRWMATLCGGRTWPVEDAAQAALHRLTTGVDRDRAPPRTIRDWQLETTLESTDRYTEVLASHRITPKTRRVLRIWPLPQLADTARRDHVYGQLRWEADVLQRVGRHAGVLHADPFFEDERGLVLPLEHFEGVSLHTWLEHHKDQRLEARVQLWRKIAATIGHCHSQGVVHRQLRPEVVRVSDRGNDPDIRIVGFDLAKLEGVSATVTTGRLKDADLQFAAPEVIQQFGKAEPRSDIFGLGVLLATLAVGRPPFESTVELLRRNGVVTPLREVAPGISQRLDDAVRQMLAMRAADRPASVDEAIAAVEAALDLAGPLIERRAAPRLDPEDLQPGTALGSDYIVKARIGRGGLSTVYECRHVPSGQRRALKVARPTEDAHQDLRHEFDVLSRLQHGNIVRAYDITRAVPDRDALPLEFIEGATMNEWLQATPEPDPDLVRRYAGDLLTALIYLEGAGLLHKDIKPDNLMIARDRLVVIDFSLVASAATEVLVGTAMYRDPSLISEGRWTHAADRYAAALCLHELFTGRHPFGGSPPDPGSDADLDVDELGAAMVGFFKRALARDTHARYPSAEAMRSAMLEALARGTRNKPDAEAPAAAPIGLDPATPLTATDLAPKAARALRQAGILHVRDLLALSDDALRGLHGMGTRRLQQVERFRAALRLDGATRAAGTDDGAGGGDSAQNDDGGTQAIALAPTLVGSEDSIATLGLSAAQERELAGCGLLRVGSVAACTETDLMQLGLARATRAAVAAALLRRAAADDASIDARTLHERWEAAVAGCAPAGRRALEAWRGFDSGRQRNQGEVAELLGVTQPEVSRLVREANEHLDPRPLAVVVDALGHHLEAMGGVDTVAAATAAFRGMAPWDDAQLARGVLRVLEQRNQTDWRLHADLDDARDDLLAQSRWDRSVLQRVLHEARELSAWPPTEVGAAERSLRALLPDYPLSTAALAARVTLGVTQAGTGELYQPPVRPQDAITWVAQRERPPIGLLALRARCIATFGDDLLWPDPAAAASLLTALPGLRLRAPTEAEVADGRFQAEETILDLQATASVLPAKLAEADPLPEPLQRADRSPTDALVDVLRDAAEHGRHWRLVMARPDLSVSAGPALAARIGAQPVSFADAFFGQIEERFDSLARAERYLAQRPRLRREAEATLDALLAQYGRPGARVLLYDVGVLELCDAIDLCGQQLYQRTLPGTLGFWCVLAPGVVSARQPRFGSGEQALFHLEGAVFPLTAALGGQEGTVATAGARA